MAKVAERVLNNKLEAYAFANDLLGKFAGGQEIRPIIVKYSYRKQRTNPQNSLYWVWLNDKVVPFFVENPTKLVDFILRRVMKMNVTADLVHAMLKAIYNHSLSTTSNDTKRMGEYMEMASHDLYHDYGIEKCEPILKGYEDVR